MVRARARARARATESPGPRWSVIIASAKDTRREFVQRPKERQANPEQRCVATVMERVTEKASAPARVVASKSTRA